MPKKRKSRGRSKGSKGKEDKVQCDSCGAWIPRSKAKKITRFLSPVDPQLAKELEKKGAIIQRIPVTKYYCVSCAIFRGIVKIRSREERKRRRPLRR
ncbi:MAG: 30S ribosomal protein S26e [archaeon GB-1867-035]|nr:30S ribosomal protein S26e [Candidatus Culexmicrobium profundum]